MFHCVYFANLKVRLQFEWVIVRLCQISGYYGQLYSGDDFYALSSGLTVQETTNSPLCICIFGVQKHSYLCLPNHSRHHVILSDDSDVCLCANVAESEPESQTEPN